MSSLLNHQNSLNLLNQFVEMSIASDNLAVAEMIIGLAIKEAEFFGQTNQKYVNCLEQQASILFRAKKYESSTEVYAQCLKHNIFLYGERSINTILLKCKLADAYDKVGHHANAKKLFQEAQAFFKSDETSYKTYLDLVNLRLMEIQKIQEEVRVSPKFYSDQPLEFKKQSMASVQQRRNYSLPQTELIRD